MLTLRLFIWGFGERKLYDSLHHFTASQCVIKCALLTFSSLATSDRVENVIEYSVKVRVTRPAGKVSNSNGF